MAKSRFSLRWQQATLLQTEPCRKEPFTLPKTSTNKVLTYEALLPQPISPVYEARPKF
jgi:hypothetical protein